MMMTMYGARVIIPSDIVARDWFDLSIQKFHEKVRSGEIALPVIRMEDSQKSAKGVHLLDLAAYVDQRRDAARREATKCKTR
ncbi:MAG: pyocin activator PrtN family protein [Alphaproteobacteria bacterium]